MTDHIHQWERGIGIVFCKHCGEETEQYIDCGKSQFLVYGYGGIICAYCYEERYSSIKENIISSN